MTSEPKDNGAPAVRPGPLRLKGTAGKKRRSKPKVPGKPADEEAAPPVRLRDESEYTEAELRFQLLQARRMEGKVRLAAEKTHRERIEEFNSALAKKTEHNDLPKIGPG